MRCVSVVRSAGPPRHRPQPPSWRELTGAAQQNDPASTLSLYRDALRLRRGLSGLADDEPLTWHDLGDDVLAFDRGSRFRCVVNLSARPVPLAGQGQPVLTSDGRNQLAYELQLINRSSSTATDGSARGTSARSTPPGSCAWRRAGATSS